MTGEVSHGIGGAGNIGKDDTKYVDGEIVRVGEQGSHGDGAFSTGRGGKSLLFYILASCTLARSLRVSSY
jgi:hypothetical protein